MTMLSLHQIAKLLQATVIGDLGADSDVPLAFSSVEIDSRVVQPGALFIALKGQRYDAHQFLEQAVARGAVALLVMHTDAPFYQNTAHSVPSLLVRDTQQALGALAKIWRSFLSLSLAVVVGSNGKTTVKGMIAAIFQAFAGESAFFVDGNLNNQIGLPLSLLKIRTTHTMGVIELGINHPGETLSLATIAQPTVAVITNAQREHQQYLKDVDTVAQEHAQLLTVLPKSGTAVFVHNSRYSALWQSAAGHRKTICFALVDDLKAARKKGLRMVGQYNPAAHCLTIVIKNTTENTSIAITLSTLGRHNAENALCAAAAAYALDIPLSVIKQGLENFQPVKGRLSLVVKSQESGVRSERSTPTEFEWQSVYKSYFSNLTLIDDTYNANPDSVRAAIEVLADFPAPRILILGDMREIGAHACDWHQEIGQYAKKKAIDYLFALGAHSKASCAAFGVAAQHFANHTELIRFLSDYLMRNSARATILVKGSRFMKMEQIIEGLIAALQCNKE